MKRKKLWIGMLVMLLLFGLTGCPQEPSEKTYTVWVSTESYSEYASVFGALVGEKNKCKATPKVA